MKKIQTYLHLFLSAVAGHRYGNRHLKEMPAEDIYREVQDNSRDNSSIKVAAVSCCM